MASNKPPNIIVEALRGSRIPQGYLLGRSSMGTGAVELLTLAQLKSVGLASVTLPPSGPAGGDLSGTYPNPTVAKLQGNPVSVTAPDALDVLAWSGVAWAPLDLAAVAYSNSYLDLINLPPLTGGTAGQVLTKISGTTYDFGWAAPAGGTTPGSAMDDGTNLYLAMIDGAGQLILDAFGDPIWALEVLPPAALPVGSSSAFGATKVDNVSILALAGVIATKACAFYAIRSADQSVTDSTNTTLLCDNVLVDTLGNYVAGTGKFTPTKAGKWFFFAGTRGQVATVMSGTLLFIYKNAALQSLCQMGAIAAGNAGSSSVFSFAICDMNGTTDFAIAQGYVAGTGGSDVFVGSSSQTFFGGLYLGA